MPSREPRLAESVPAVLAAIGVPLLAGMVCVFAAQAGSFLVSSYVPRALRRAGLSASLVEGAARWALPLLNACLTAVIAHRVYAGRQRAHPTVWTFAAVSALSLVVLGLVFGFRFSLSFRRLSLSTWYSLSVPITFAAGLAGGWLGKRRCQRRKALSGILDRSAGGCESVRTALGDYAQFASVPAICALLGGSAFFVSKPRLERHRQALEAAGAAIAALSSDVVSRTPSALGIDRFPPDVRRLLAPLGIRSLAFLPLNGLDAAAPDFAVLYFTRPGFLTRNQWQFGLLAAQLRLRLENARLLETARRSAVLEERQRLAREIHDTIAQDLIGIVVNLEALERASGAGGDEPANRTECIREAVRTARRGLQETRRLVWALRPIALEENPLPAALSRCLREWSSRSGTDAEFLVEGEPYRLQPDAEITLFRMLQEACSNVARHARAGHVRVRLEFTPGEVVLCIRDDGVGMEEQREGGKGFGLSAMRERIESLGGVLTVRSGTGAGTELSAAIPRVAASVPEGEDGEDPRPDRR